VFPPFRKGSNHVNFLTSPPAHLFFFFFFIFYLDGVTFDPRTRKIGVAPLFEICMTPPGASLVFSFAEFFLGLCSSKKCSYNTLRWNVFPETSPAPSLMAFRFLLIVNPFLVLPSFSIMVVGSWVPQTEHMTGISPCPDTLTVAFTKKGPISLFFLCCTEIYPFLRDYDGMSIPPSSLVFPHHHQLPFMATLLFSLPLGTR